MRSNKAVKRLADGDTTFYQFGGKPGFWGAPKIEQMITYDDQPNAPITVTHNADGNRDADFVRADPGQKTVVCFGGSHSWGASVEQDERYTERLAESSSCRVANLGYCSLRLHQVCLALMQKSAKYKPDIVAIEQYPWSVTQVINPYVNGFMMLIFHLNSQQELKLKKVSRPAKFKLYRKLVGT